jgi:acetyl-CoA C-acetyltransferase
MSIYIYDAVRTPRGKGRRGGSLAEVTPAQLVGQLVRALERRIGPDAVAAIEHFTLGSVTQVGAQGGHLALAARIQAGLPDDLPCLTINNFCVSGLSAIADAARRVASGQVDLALAGGVESMSQVAFMTDAADYYADMPLAASMGWAPWAWRPTCWRRGKVSSARRWTRRCCDPTRARPRPGATDVMPAG